MQVKGRNQTCVCSIAMALFLGCLFIPVTNAFSVEVESHGMCEFSELPEDFEGTPPQDRRNFEAGDQVCVWLMLSNFYSGSQYEIRAEWYQPNGSSLHPINLEYGSKRYSEMREALIFGCLMESGEENVEGIPNIRGEWTAKVYEWDNSSKYFLHDETFTVGGTTTTPSSIPGSSATITNHMMTKDPKRDTGCETPTPNYTFSTEDDMAYSWLDLDNRIVGDVIKWEWYDPNSAFYVEDTYTMSSTGNGCVWMGVAIRDNDLEEMPGDWHIDVFHNDTFQFTENFTIKGGSCPILLIYGSDSKETELLRSLRDNVLSKTSEGQELIKLYYQWSPVIVRAMESDEDFKQEVKEMVDEVLTLVEED